MSLATQWIVDASLKARGGVALRNPTESEQGVPVKYRLPRLQAEPNTSLHSRRFFAAGDHVRAGERPTVPAAPKLILVGSAHSIYRNERRERRRNHLGPLKGIRKVEGCAGLIRLVSSATPANSWMTSAQPKNLLKVRQLIALPALQADGSSRRAGFGARKGHEWRPQSASWMALTDRLELEISEPKQATRPSKMVPPTGGPWRNRYHSAPFLARLVLTSGYAVGIWLDGTR